MITITRHALKRFDQRFAMYDMESETLEPVIKSSIVLPKRLNTKRDRLYLYCPRFEMLLALYKYEEHFIVKTVMPLVFEQRMHKYIKNRNGNLYGSSVYNYIYDFRVLNSCVFWQNIIEYNSKENSFHKQTA